jgi:hypothetical protein
MSGAIPPLPQYTFMAWCSVKAQGQLYLYLYCFQEPRLRVFENRVLRRTFGLKREQVARGKRILYNKELHNLHTSPNIIRVIKSRRKRCAEYVARMGEMGNTYKILVGNLREETAWKS